MKLILFILVVIELKAKLQAQRSGFEPSGVQFGSGVDSGVGGSRPGLGIGVGFGGNTAGVNGQAPICGGTSEEYSYTLNAELYRIVVKRKNKRIPNYRHPGPSLILAFPRTIDDENPLNIRGWALNYEADFRSRFGETNITSACNDPNDCSWLSAAAKFVQTNIMPNGTCPVQKGTYMLYSSLDPVTVTFTEEIPPGVWIMSVTAADKAFELSLFYRFNVTVCDNC